VLDDRFMVWGINDADYQVVLHEGKGGERRSTWRCPFYSRWADMLSRCYSESRRHLTPTYKDCSICDEWLLFSNFRKWMATQHYEGMHLDKDILVPNNKVYSPTTCCFIPVRVNVFFCGANAIRGDYPIGVSLRSDGKKYRMECFKPFGKRYNGSYNTVVDAHNAWVEKKIFIASILAETEGLDPRIKNILRDPEKVKARLQE
jgi:hypothetical protein